VIRTLIALLLGALFLVCSFVASAQSPEYHGPSWSTIAGWLGSIVGLFVVGWAARLETVGRDTNKRVDDIEEAHEQAQREMRSHYDARIAEAMARSADITLRLSEYKLEMTRQLTNHPTKTDFERGMEKLADQVERMNLRFDSFVRGQRDHG
jgi:hypothetical protein